MAPWWKHRSSELQPCEQCGETAVLHEGLCKHCRHGTRVGRPRAEHPPVGERTHAEPDLEPAHDRPWVHRGGG